jgi:hypothetical protein
MSHLFSGSALRLFSLIAFIVCAQFLAISLLNASPVQSRDLHKRSFVGLGCLGTFDKAKFARLDRVCEECYNLYREPELQGESLVTSARPLLVLTFFFFFVFALVGLCRNDCFRNDIFTRCVDALLLKSEQKKFEDMVNELYGK